MITVEPRATLTDPERAAIAALVGALQARGVDARIVAAELNPDSRTPLLLAFDGAQLVGVAAADRFGDSAEVTLALAPDAPEGTGAALLATLPASVGAGVAQLVMLNDRAATKLAALYSANGFQPDHAEQMLRLAAGTSVRPTPTALTISAADATTIPVIAAVIAADWGVPLDVAMETVTGNIRRLDVTYYLATLSGAPVGTLNVQRLDGRPWIYGFMVTEHQRGQGYGRQILTRVLADTLAASPGDLFLEVDEANAVAQNLYRSLGFAPVRTFEYWSKRL